MRLTFIEMFSGIGGFRLGLERSGWNCVWANDWDKYANTIYKKHFGNKELMEGDIREIEANSISTHTLLTAGFPCQAFSIAGKRKGISESRGTLFHHIARVASAKKPKLLLLENVKGILSSDSGRTFAIILRTLDGLGYDVEWQMLNSKHFGVPQNRERVFIVGHLGGRGGREVFPVGEADEVAEGEGGGRSAVQDEASSAIHSRYGAGWRAHAQEQLVSTAIDRNYWKGPDKHGRRTLVAESALIHSRGIETRKNGISHALKGGGGGSSKNLIQIGTIGKNSEATRVYDPNGIARTVKHGGGLGAKTGLYVVGNIYPSKGEAGKVVLSEGIYPTVKQGKRGGKANIGGNISIRDTTVALQSGASHNYQGIIQNMKIRRLTPVECERLQGFPDGWTEGISDTQRYKLLGNAVTVNVVEFLGRRLRDRCF